MTFTLKTQGRFFDAIERGIKTFEIRKEDDKRFEPGDRLVLLRLDDETGEPDHSRTLGATVEYVLRDVPEFGLLPGFACLSIVTSARKLALAEGSPFALADRLDMLTLAKLYHARPERIFRVETNLSLSVVSCRHSEPLRLDTTPAPGETAPRVEPFFSEVVPVKLGEVEKVGKRVLVSGKCYCGNVYFRAWEEQ